MKRKLTALQRKVIYDVFAEYRAYKTAIANHTLPVKRGFASAMHPDQIHAPRVHGGEPHGLTGSSVTPGFTDAAFRRFIWRVDWHVKQLKPYRRAIIRMRFLGREPLPKDNEVYLILYKSGWFVSKRFFDSEKREAFEELYRELKPQKQSDITTDADESF